MSTPGTIVLRRTWPQRLVLLMGVGVIAAALFAAWVTDSLYRSVGSIQRVEISGEVLRRVTRPGEPVNFLLIGTDSALGLDPDDPATFGRVYDPRGTFFADSITILRLDPVSSQAWVVSIPRDLLVDIPGSSTNRINAALLIGGPELLIETITSAFDIEINHYVELDFLAFREVVDQLGGVPVWFDHPARDQKSFLEIPVAGCSVLDGETALAYVRARRYQEFIDGEWVSDNRSDFGRIERQQDFLVLALDRAIDRGARNPTSLARLIEAGAESVVLDTRLTPAQLIDLGEDFSEFNPETLERSTVEVVAARDANGVYRGEQLVPEVNDAIFTIFRGAADLVPVDEVGFQLRAGHQALLDHDGSLLRDIGFSVEDENVFDGAIPESVIVHPPGARQAAETVARYLLPVPALAVDPLAETITVYLGADHDQVSFLFPQDVAITRAAISARGVVAVPEPTATTPPSAPVSSDPGDPTTPETGSPTTTTAAVGQIDGPSVDPPGRIIGRPPEGESCG